MHKFPPSVTIGGIKIAIQLDNSLESWGEYHADDRMILLSYRACEKRSSLRETLRHEIMHASLDICGLSHLKNFEEEVIVRCLDNVFHPAWESVRTKLTSQ